MTLTIATQSNNPNNHIKKPDNLNKRISAPITLLPVPPPRRCIILLVAWAFGFTSRYTSFLRVLPCGYFHSALLCTFGLHCEL